MACMGLEWTVCSPDEVLNISRVYSFKFNFLLFLPKWHDLRNPDKVEKTPEGEYILTLI